MRPARALWRPWPLLGLSIWLAVLLVATFLTTMDSTRLGITRPLYGRAQAASLARSMPLANAEPLPLPSGLTVTGITQTSVTLAWEAATDDTGVAGYRLYERIKVNPYFSHWVLVVDQIPAAQVTVSGLAPGSQHRYAVAAFDVAGNESPKSAILRVQLLQTPVPFHTTQPGERLFAIVGELFQYDIDALGVPPPVFTLVSGPAGMTVERVSGLVQWTPDEADVGTISATVRATNSEDSGDHTFSVPVYPAGADLVPPGPVTQLVATTITTHSATLTWSPAIDNVGVAGYWVYAQREGHGQSLFLAGDTLSPTIIFTVAALQPATGYRLWVAAYDAAGNVGSISGITPLRIITQAEGETATPTLVPTEPAPGETPMSTSTPLPPGHVQIEVKPTQPTADDVIILRVSGVYTSSCTPEYQSHQVTGNVITIVSAAPDQSFCLPAEFPWGFAIELSPLAPGDYTVLHMLDGMTDTTHFTVIEAPAATETPSATPAEPGAPPTIQVADDEVLSAAVGEEFRYTVTARGEPSPIFTLLAGPPGMTIDTHSGVLTWTPAEGIPPTVAAAVRAANAVGSDDYTFQIAVYPANGSQRLLLPVITGAR